MVGTRYCCVVGCKNSQSRNRELIFYSFPTRSWEIGKRKEWIKAIGRITKDNKPWQPSKNTRICSAHFVGGKQSYIEKSPAYIPTIFPSVYKKKEKSQLALAGHKRLMKRKERMSTSTASKPQESENIASDIEMDESVQNDGNDNHDLSLYLQLDKKPAATASAAEDSSERNSNIHQGYTCNNCSAIIEGYRYTCVQCSDYDLCATCEARGAHCLHYVLRIPTPRPYDEIQSVLNKIRSQLLYGVDTQADSDETTIKAEIKEEIPDPLDTDDTAETAQIDSEINTYEHDAPKDTNKRKEISKVNTATTVDTIQGNKLLIIENPVSTGSVASSTTPLADNTKRKHVNMPTPIIEKRIKLEPEDSQVPDIESDYIDVPITGYVPVPTASDDIGTSYVSGGMSQKDSAKEDAAGESSFQVFSHTPIHQAQAKPRRFGKASSTFSRTKTRDTSNK